MKDKTMENLNFKSSQFKVIVLTLILTVSILFNVMYLLGIIEYKLKTKEKIEFIDSPIQRQYINPPMYEPIDIDTINEMELIKSPIDESMDSIINPNDFDSIEK